MPQRYPFKALPSYPGMKPADIAIWERFIKLYPDAYDSVMYNMQVGQGSAGQEHDDEDVQNGWHQLKCRKIDVVGFSGERVDVIELKPHAGPSAIGQVVGYIHLYHGYRDPHSSPNPVLITDSNESDMDYLCARLNVRRVIV